MKKLKNMKESTNLLYQFIIKEMPVINKTQENVFSLDYVGISDIRITVKELNLIAKKLNSSCDNAVKRGKPNYLKPGYENVTCQWNTGLQMKKGLMSLDKKVIQDFVIFSLMWIVGGKKDEDKPCFTRPNDKGNYVVGNIVVDTRLNNELGKSRESVSRPCMLIATVNGSVIPEEITPYKSTIKAAESVVERLKLQCTPKTLQAKASEGKRYKVLDEDGNVWSVLMQTDYSKNPDQSGMLSVEIGGKKYYPY
ncbi:hypothetical protein [Paenibacillus sp. FSL L8-0506]|uniref:hypothetical protein n=1 Tax=Paenibacillus sp. FSL L8-0506 TaxID=2975335 RepID=UPI0030FC78E8